MVRVQRSGFGVPGSAFRVQIAWILVVLVLTGPAQPASAQQEPAPPPIPMSFKRASPYASLARTGQTLNALALELVLNMGYAEQGEADGLWKTAGLDGLGLQRYFRKTTPDTLAATLELAAARNPSGGYDLYVYGEAEGGPNPDLPRVEALMQALTATDLPVVNLVDVAYQPYTLSYTNTDRVLAVLKALGYDTIEYSEGAGTAFDMIYNPVLPDTTRQLQNTVLRLPYVVKFIDAAKTSLLDPVPGVPYEVQAEAEAAQRASIAESTVPDIGGSYLHQMTSGEPPQRLLIVYDRNAPDERDHLIDLLRNTIDRPAHQVAIEALVVELNESAARDLGVTFSGAGDQVNVELTEDRETGLVNPFVFNFDTSRPDFAFTFRAQLSALVDEGAAEVLSNPSVLVLDGRQARIQIGQQVPITKQAVTEVGAFGSIEYLPVGIVLNLRPRISEDRAEITMQVETIVSSIVQFTGQIDVAQAPVIDNRRVQTFVRVFDNTPFIIGGLISTETLERRVGVPVLSRIPLLGALFRKTITATEKKEVIVVLTPHVIDLDEGSPSQVIPKDADVFDSFDKTLFRNTYRIRRDDVYDLNFVDESVQALRQRVEARARTHPAVRKDSVFARLLAGGIPGEEVLVRRMLYEIIVEKLRYEQYIDPEKMLFFGERRDDGGLDVLDFKPYLDSLDAARNALALVFDTQAPDAPGVLNPPAPSVRYLHLDGAMVDYRNQLRDLNAGRAAILVTDPALIPHLNLNPRQQLDPLQQLKGILVMKRLLDVNETLDMTLRDFRPGRQIVFPSKRDLVERFHIIDTDAARYFYDVYNYYVVFQTRFAEEANRLLERLDALFPEGP